MPNQQKVLVTKNFAPSVADFLGTDDPIKQQEAILEFSKMQTGQLSAAFINAGGSWQRWYDEALKSCSVNKETTEIFTRGVNGDQAAIREIATNLDMPYGKVADLLAQGEKVVSQGEQTYSEAVTMRDLIGLTNRGTGLHSEAL